MQRRTTQRAPLSCVFCTRRKIRCSKTLPCSNCVERGLGDRCHRESVVVSNRRLRRNATFQEASSPTSPPSNDDRSIERAPHIDGQATDNLFSFTPIQGTRNGHAQSINGQNEGNLAIEAAMSLESLAWGTHRETTNVLLSPAILALVAEVHALIDTTQALAILNFHKTHIAWMHNVVYMPIFIRECEAFLDGKAQRDPAWLSLYCAVITTGVYYMSESQHCAIELRDGFEVCQRLYQVTTEVIMRSDFMVIQSMHSLQAICVILMCSHSLGDSRRMKVLLSSATSIAHNFHHRLHLRRDTTSNEVSFEELVEREIRRRVWCFLCTQDWYLIASKKSYSIVPSHNTTPAPANCKEDFDDIIDKGDFFDHPLSVSTQSTYMIFLAKLTSKYRSLFDRICQCDANGGSITDCFNEILSADSEFEAFVDEISDILSNEKASNTDPHAAIQWHSLIIASWHLRLMIHRNFFCRSFRDRQYHYSRFVSLVAARNILRHNLEFLGVEIWSIPVHTISACIIISLNWLFTAEKHTLEKSDISLMQRCLVRLKESSRPNFIVDRGIQIIQHLFNQRPQNRFHKLDMKEISELAQEINITVPDSNRQEDVEWYNENQAFAMNKQFDVDQAEDYFGGNGMYMEGWYDSLMQNYNL